VFFAFLAKFRKRADDDSPAMYIAGEKDTETRWVTIPHGLVLVCDVFVIIAAVQVWVTVKIDKPPADNVVRVVAQQWAWTFIHPGPDGKLDTDDDIAINDELHVPVDSVTHYELVSRDVMHDFSVPVLRLKQDALPGRVITGWFEPTLTGEFDIQCAEMCGIGHGLMPARIFVESPKQHAAWVAENSSTTVAAVSVD
jgi:cytochrome c oxidase subunit 2